MLCLKDYEKDAKKNMDGRVWAFYSQGAERELNLKENLQSFTRYALIPRMLRNSIERDVRTTLLGRQVSSPIAVAPVAYQKLAHPDGETASSRAASAAGLLYTLSTVSNTPLEDVVKNRPSDSPIWMQVYVFKNRDATKKLILSAENAGYRALVLTVDTPVIGLQLRSRRKGGLTLPPHVSAPNFQPVAPKQDVSFHTNNTKYIDCTLTWDDIDWIKRFSKLPIIIKGILSVEDALQAVKHGVAAIWISNHGGRQLDGTLTAMEVLPEVSSALSGTGIEVYADGGVRWGSDVLKLLAAGARAVFIGRPVLWGLAHSGEAGVRAVLEILHSELDRAMHLAGCNSLSDIGPHLLKKLHTARL